MKLIFSIIGILNIVHKTKRFLRWHFVGVLLFFCLSSNATHIVGGELTYRYVGNDQYEISLTVYRDCYNGVPPFDNPAYVFVYDAFNNLYTIISMVLQSHDTMPPLVNSPCFIPPLTFAMNMERILSKRLLCRQAIQDTS